MRELWHDNDSDADIGALYADALLNVRPWDQWTKDGKPQPGTEEAIAALAAVLERTPDHPGANHFYIHALEASPQPERALAAADRLRTLLPAAAHLVHMPAHIYARLGRWADASAANEAAAAVDRAWFARRSEPGIYRFYFAHNLHFLAYTSMMEGRRAAALAAARELIALAPPPGDAMAGAFDGVLLARLHVLVRFGEWDAILDEPDPGPGWPLTRATWRFARGVALAALRRPDEAAKEAEVFEAACAAVPEEATVVLNPAKDVLAVARHMLQGEVLFRRGKHDEAFAALRHGVAAEMALRYDEPPGWMEPVRHALGALLLEAGKVDDALAVYREDLVRNPKNGWSLHGLVECLRKKDAPAAEVAAAERDMQAAWQRADVPLRASCACRQ
jgi:tetratricopeptide (TPR) repeat protein